MGYPPSKYQQYFLASTNCKKTKKTKEVKQSYEEKSLQTEEEKRSEMS